MAFDQVLEDAAERVVESESSEGRKLVIDDIAIDIVDEEGLEGILEQHTHPRQDGTDVTDHSRRRALSFDVVGKVVSQPRETDDHRLKTEALFALNRRASIVDMVVDFPPRVLENFQITRIRVAREKEWIDPNFYIVEMTCKESPVAQSDEAQGAIFDPDTKNQIEGVPEDFGQVEPVTWGCGSKSEADEGETKQGNEDGGGGLLGWVSDGLDAVEDVTGIDVTDVALDAVKGFANTAIPGSGAALEIGQQLLTGDFDVSNLADVALSNIPGGGVAADLLGGPASEALGFVENIPGVPSPSELLNPEDAAGSLMSGITDEVGKKAPGRGDSGEMISSNYNPASSTPCGGGSRSGGSGNAGGGTKDEGGLLDAAMDKAKDLGIPDPLLDAGEDVISGEKGIGEAALSAGKQFLQEAV